MSNSKTPGDTTPTDPAVVRVSPKGTATMGVYLAALALLIFYLLVQLITGDKKPAEPDNQISESVEVHWFWWDVSLTPEAWLLFIVILAGALGSYVHTATSFADYVGNRKLTQSWIWWLLMRTPIGMALALVFYLLLRGGLLTGVGSAESDVLNPYGFAAISALVGMFSKQATDKLREIFDNLFKTEKETERADKLTKEPATPSPKIAETAPPSVQAGTTQRTVIVDGTGFVAASKARIDGEERETKFEGETRLIFELADADVLKTGSLKLTVANPAPGGESPPHDLPITQ